MTRLHFYAACAVAVSALLFGVLIGWKTAPEVLTYTELLRRL